MPQLRQRAVHRPAQLQPDVQDLHGAGRGRLGRGLAAARDGPGRSSSTSPSSSRSAARRSRSGSPRSARRSVTRSPRGTSSSGPASSSRWSSSSSSSRAPTRSGSSTGSTSGWRWYLDLGMREENLRLRPHEPDELAHYAKRAVDIEYKFPFGWSELEGIANRADFDLPSTRSLRPGPHLPRPGDRHPLHPVRGRAVGRGRPLGPGLPGRRLPRGGGADRLGRDREAHRAALRPRPGPDQGGRAAPVAQRAAEPDGPRGRGPAARALDDRLRRRPVDRPPLPPPGRDRDAVLRHRRLRLARRTGPSPSGTATP